MTTGTLKKDIEIPDLTGRLAIVTGANSGLGFGFTKRLARTGAAVILAVRDPRKGNQAAQAVFAENPGAVLQVEQLDLGSLRSIKDFADSIAHQGQPIDYLLNNAGVMAPPTRHATTDGFELQFGVNYLGHFALTGRLLPCLRAAGKCRIMTMSSIVNRMGGINFGDLQWENKYSANAAYIQSKLANLMFALELDARSKKFDWGIVSKAAHPGSTLTKLQLTGPTLGTGKEKEPFATRQAVRAEIITNKILAIAVTRLAQCYSPKCCHHILPI